MRTNRRLLFVLIAFALFFQVVSGKTVHDAAYRFSITFPDSCQVEFSKESTTPYIVAIKKNFMAVVNIAHTEEGRYLYRKTILGSTVFNGDDYYYLQTKEPWYNLLRHSRACIESPEDGFFACSLAEFRAQTLFWIRIVCVESELDTARSILDSFDSECDLKSYYRIMNNNLRWYEGTLYITLVPCFAYLAGNKRAKWKRSGKKDEKSVLYYLIFLLVLLALISFAVFCLKDCIPLACIIGGLSLLIAAAFFFKWEFIMNFFEGLF